MESNYGKKKMPAEKPGMKDFVADELNSIFVDNIPIEQIKQLPFDYMCCFGSLAYLAMLSAFIFFVITSYNNSVNERFISLDNQAGECDVVPIPVTGTYLADTNGNWIGTTKFWYSRAAFNMQLSNFRAESQSEYESMLQTFYNSLHEVGLRATQENLAYTLLNWMSYVKYYNYLDPQSEDFADVGYDRLQFIQLTGTPSVVFDLPYNQASISYEGGICNMEALTKYDKANTLLTATFDANDFTSNDICLSALYPAEFYSESYLASDYTFTLNVESFVTAISVNMGILKLSDLGVASPVMYNIVYDGVPYLGRDYFDFRYTSMDPILCVQNTTSIPSGNKLQLQHICVLRKSVTIAMLPTFDHFGLSSDEPLHCDCNSEFYDNDACQQFMLLSSLIFFKPVSEELTTDTIIDELLLNMRYVMLTLSKYDNYTAFNRAAYNASVVTAASVFTSNDADMFFQENVKRAFDFCRIDASESDGSIENLGCSMLTFYQYDLLSYGVSENHYQLNNGSCYDSITPLEENWLKLQKVPPVAILETYYECIPTRSSAALNAVGVASGNTSIAMLLFFIAILPFVYYVLASINKVPNEEYTAEERNDATELLAILLLRIRDGKKRGIKQNGVLTNLAKELMVAATIHDVDGSKKAEENSWITDETTSQRFLRNRVAYNSDHTHGQTYALPYSQGDKDNMIESGEYYTSAEKGEQSGTGGLAKQESIIDRKKLSVFAQRPEFGMSKKLSRQYTSVRDVSITSDIRILNLVHDKALYGSTESHHDVTPDEELDILVADMLRYFSTALLSDGHSNAHSTDAAINSVKSPATTAITFTPHSTGVIDQDTLTIHPPTPTSTNNSNANSNAMYSSRRTGKGLEHDIIQARKTICAYLLGKQMATRLCYVDFEKLLEREDKTIFNKLNNLLCMHASIDMGLEMQDVALNHMHKVAYDVGGKLLTGYDLQQLVFGSHQLQFLWT